MGNCKRCDKKECFGFSRKQKNNCKVLKKIDDNCSFYKDKSEVNEHKILSDMIAYEGKHNNI